MPDPNRPNDSKSIGDAGSLFDTDEIRPIHVAPTPEPTSSNTNPAEGYDLEGGPLVDDEELPAPIPIPIPARPVDRPKSADRPKSVEKPKLKANLEFEPPDLEGSSEFHDEAADVDETWSRWGEWGPDLIRVGAVGLGTIVLAWMFQSLLILVFGLAAMVLLSYPILITLERPVRITPEHAVTDFFDAASHHFPHYRRMWLLLSSLGRDSAGFETFGQFREHWKARIDGWKKAKAAGKFTPLKFEVENFRSDKSTGKETSKADYSVLIYVRDRETEGPIETYRMSHGLVKGSDRMWYMNQGVLGKSSK